MWMHMFLYSINMYSTSHRKVFFLFRSIPFLFSSFAISFLFHFLSFPFSELRIMSALAFKALAVLATGRDGVH